MLLRQIADAARRNATTAFTSSTRDLCNDGPTDWPFGLLQAAMSSLALWYFLMLS
jgi:hypothetical protein